MKVSVFINNKYNTKLVTIYKNENIQEVIILNINLSYYCF